MQEDTKDLHEARYYVKDYKGKKDIVQCNLCPNNCIISEGKFGNCRVRKNVKGKLYSMVYGRSAAVAIDPIEKKPLYHFLPSTSIFSFGTLGCNLHCKHCQNYTTSQVGPGGYPDQTFSPEELVRKAVKSGCKSIAATYNEPTIFYEYMFDTFKLAKSKGLRTVMVTNGYMNLGPAEKIAPYVDALNIDLKAFTEKFYKEITGAKLKPVLEAIKFWHKKKKWIELTYLIIPTLNDNLKEIKDACDWINENVGNKVPVHFTAFYPTYELNNLEPTSEDILIKAYDIAKKAGLKYVYVGNIMSGERENTFCPKCGKKIVGRFGFSVLSLDVEKGKCKFCKAKVDGVWS